MPERRIPVVPSAARRAIRTRGFSWRAARLLTGLAAASVLLPAHAGTHDERFDCKSNPHAFIASLIDDQSIEPQPSRVEPNSVNAFRPAHGNRLSAFGFPIYAVIGYARDDTLFRQGAGKAIDGAVYGVVVSAPADSVRLRLREANSDATVQSVVPLLLTAIVCHDGEPGAGARVER